MATADRDWIGRKVLVTGGAGFLGSNLCHALVQRGARVCAIDDFLPDSGANPFNLHGSDVELVRGDVGSIDLGPHLADVSAVFNLAGRTSHMGGQRDLVSDVAVNILAQIRLIQALREHAPAAVVVHASTRQLYGRPQRLPVAEDHPVAPPDANSISKFAGEWYWMLENRTNGRRVVSLRLTNCYGPRLRICDGKQGFLGRWIGQILRHEPFELWGGEQLRDPAFVDDVTEAFLMAATVPACQGGVFNIGGAGSAPLRHIADLIVDLCGRGASYVGRAFPVDRAAIDIGSYCADDSLFRKTTGWSPKIDFREGFGRTLDWFRRNQSAYL